MLLIRVKVGVKASGFLSRFGSSSSVASDPDQGDDLEGGSSVAPDPSQGGIEGSLEGFDPKTRVRAAVMCRYEMCKHEFHRRLRIDCVRLADGRLRPARCWYPEMLVSKEEAGMLERLETS